ncbi:hypothetical protein K0U00_41845, partial [Paenibacillus sepulcri]|nr:hypothetical protein [Paenibacillus sepulcri]
MTGNIRDSSRVLLQGAVELLLFLPVAFLIQAFLLGNEAGWLWLILALLGYPAGLLINRLFTFKHPFMITLVGIVIGCACSALLFGVTKTGALSAVVLSASLSRGGLMAVSMRLFRLQARHYIIGIFVYFFVSLFFGRAEAFQPYKIPLIVFGLAVLMLTLFASNSSYVNDESLSGSDRPSVEPTVRKQNRMLVGIIAAVAVLIVFTYQIQAALTSLWNAFRNWLQQL